MCLSAGLFAETEERRDCSFVKAGQGGPDRAARHQGRAPLRFARPLTRRRDRVEPYLITLTEARTLYAFPPFRRRVHLHAFGKVHYRHADRTYPMEPGDALFFDAAARHGPEHLIKVPMQYLSIIIYPRKVSENGGETGAV